MEPSSAPEKQAPEPRFIRPPGLEMGNGLAIFSLAFMVFSGAQFFLMASRVRSLTPDMQGIPLASLFSIEGFAERWEALSTNGDVIAFISLWAGLAGLVVLLGITAWWKGPRTVQFLGLRPPALKPFLAWCGFFLVVFILLEALAYLLPDMDGSFMEQVIASITSRPMFLLGAALMPAIYEELLFRGLLLGSLRHMLDKHSAIAITAGVFTFIHMQYDWYLLLLQVLPLAVFLGYARANTGSIWTSIVLHFANNAASVLLPALFPDAV